MKANPEQVAQSVGARQRMRFNSPRMLGRVTLAVGSLLFLLLILELGLRAWGYDLNSSEYWRFHPTLGWVLESDHPLADLVNTNGFRFKDVTKEKPERVKRVLVLGDSFTAAGSLPYKETLPGRIQERLKGSEDWEVISLAVGDWGTAQQLLAMNEYGLAYAPEVVVLQVFPFNDLCNNSLELAFTCSMQDAYRPYLEPGLDRMEIRWLDEWRARLRRWSLVFGFFEGRLVRAQMARDNLNPDDPASVNRYYEERGEKLGVPLGGALASLLEERSQPFLVRRAWKTTAAIFAEMNQELASEGVRLMAVVIPYVHTLEPYWQRYGVGRLKDLSPEHGTRETEELLRALEIPVISVREGIKASRHEPGEFFMLPEDSHLSPLGHDEIARWVVGELAGQGLTSLSKARSESE